MAEHGEELTERELEITELVAEGLTNREVAARLFLSPNTVKVHLRNIFTKTGVSSRTELSMLAIQEGWISVPGTPEETGTSAEEASSSVADNDGAEAVSARHWLPAWPWQRWVTLAVGLVLVALILALPQRPSMPVVATGPDDIFGSTGVGSALRAPAADDGWEELAPLPVRRAGMGTAAYDDRIFVIGGMTDEGSSGRVDIYDTVTDVWEAGAPRPVALANVNAAVLDDKIIVPGGCDSDFVPASVVHLYDPVADTWSEAAPLPTPLCAYALAVYEGRAFLFGGWDGQTYRAAAYMYDPDEDVWTSVRRPSQARGFAAAAALDDRIYFVGGYDKRREWSSCEAYIPDTDTWETCASMLQPRGGLTLTAIGGRLYAIGGGWQSLLVFNERYTPDTDEWSIVETPIVGEWRNLSAVPWETSIYVVGGWSDADFLNRTYAVEILPWRVFIPGTFRGP